MHLRVHLEQCSPPGEGWHGTQVIIFFFDEADEMSNRGFKDQTYDSFFKKMPPNISGCAED